MRDTFPNSRRVDTAREHNINDRGEVVDPTLYCLDPLRVWLTVPGVQRRFGDVSRSVISKAIKSRMLAVERRPNIRPGTFIALDSAERWIQMRRTSNGPPVFDDTGQLRLFNGWHDE